MNSRLSLRVSQKLLRFDALSSLQLSLFPGLGMNHPPTKLAIAADLLSFQWEQFLQAINAITRGFKDPVSRARAVQAIKTVGVFG